MSKEKRIKTKRPFDFDQFWGIWNLVEAAIVLVAGVFGIVYRNSEGHRKTGLHT